MEKRFSQDTLEKMNFRAVNLERSLVVGGVLFRRHQFEHGFSKTLADLAHDFHRPEVVVLRV